MLPLIPLIPFVGFLLNAGLGRRIGKGVAGAIACGAIIASFLVSLVQVLQLVALAPESRNVVQNVYEWFTSGDVSVSFSLLLDPLSSLMILVVTGIGSLIHIYSTAYMHEETDSEYARYFSYLNLFAAFMLVLVLGANFLVLFIGWEGVGLCSYLLIGFWYQKKSASDAGKKAFIVNRIGDFAFILGVLLIIVRFGTVDFHEIARALSSRAPEAAFGTVSLISLLLFIGATGKSAQIPLYVWLPDAMEGPTPVSALIHAATMVTAGVYMIGRNAVLFSHAPETLSIVAVIGTATAFMAGSIGLVQNDIKRVLAYSTVSQLGFMFLAMGVGAYEAGIFHLYTHAFFKALLFLGSGAVIHALGGEQDLRKMGGLKRLLPVTYWTFLIGAVAIAGVPGLAGFFSKDEILFRSYPGGYHLLWMVGLLTSFLTAIYMFRLVFLTFHGERAEPAHADAGHTGHVEAHGADDHGAHPGTHGHGGRHPYDAPPAMAFALIVLALGSVLAGYVGFPRALGGSNPLERFLEPSFTAGETAGIERAAPPAGGEQTEEASADLERGLMGVSSVVAVAGIAVAWFFFVKKRSAADELAARFAGLHTLLANKYYVDEVYSAAVVEPIRIVSQEGLWKGVDVRIIDGMVNGAGHLVGWSSRLLRRVQSGSVRVYAGSVFLGVVAVLGYFLWR